MALVASSSALPSNTSTIADVDPATFARVSEGLLRNNATPISHYLNDLSLLQSLPSTSISASQPQPIVAQETEPTIPKAVARIHQACQQAFGNTQALKFEYEDDTLTHGKRCILTITRPNGTTRTYTSPTMYGRKYDAKASVCTLAISSGAIDFIYGEPNGEPSSSAAASEQSNTPLEMDDSVKAIEQCCLEWAGGRVKPFWLNISEPKFGRTQGCALRIRLGPRNFRVYSVNTTYNGAADARKACAEVALAEGVVDYIKSWTPPDTDMDVVEETDPSSAIGLQQFFESLPQPFPEPATGRSAVDINGPAWLNTTIQSARGGKIVPNFVWTVDPRHNFHGCLLRLERPGEVKSYLVDARFSKRMEAKAAVCLLAMSEGVGDYIRGVGKAVKDKLSPAMRRHVSEVLLPLLNAEYRKVRGPGIQPTIEYDQDMDACGATMVIELATNAGPEQVRRYTVPAEYCSRNDAKLMVVQHTVQEGVIDFLRCHGNPPPSGYVSYAAQQEQPFMNRKRKNWDSGNDNGGYGNGDWSSHNGYGPPPAGSGSPGGWQNKKQRTGGAYQGNLGQGGSGPGYGQGHAFSNGQHQGYGYSGPGPHGGNQKQNGNKPSWGNGSVPYNQKQNWKRNHYNAPGPGPFGGASSSDAYAPAGQYKPGPRNGGALGPSRFVPRQQPSVPISLPPSVQYPRVPMPSQQQQHPVPPPYAYPGGGTAAGNAQPPSAASYGAVSQAQQIPIPYQTQAAQAPMAPFGALNATAPGGAAYSPYAAAPPAPPAPVQSSQQQYPYAAGYPSMPGSGQVPGYQQYPAASTHPFMIPPSGVPPPALVTPHTPSVVSTTFPYPTFHGAGPAVQAYQQQPPRPSVMPVQQPPVPASPAVQPPQPPPPSVAPPPPPPPLHAPPPPPPPSTGPSTSQPKPTPPQPTPPQPTPPMKPTPASGPLSSWPTKPKVPGKVISIPATPKTNVTELYDYCNERGLATPQWCHEIPKDQQGERRHKVWVVIGKTKFELPVTFMSLSQGQEKVAKKVVDQLRNQDQAEAAKAAGSKA